MPSPRLLTLVISTVGRDLQSFQEISPYGRDDDNWSREREMINRPTICQNDEMGQDDEMEQDTKGITRC
jgi:hypothetical protein